MRTFYFLVLVVLTSFFLAHCCSPEQQQEKITSRISADSLPPGLPAHLPAPLVPPDNYFTADRIALGKKIFFSTVFSADGKISCASCHIPSLAFADTTVISTGVNGRRGFRNTPSLVNTAWHKAYMLDGGVPTLELQVLAPFAGHDEMDFSLLRAVELLAADKKISALSKRAYGRKPDVFVVTRALACYERTLFDGDSKYDAYLIDSIKNPLSASEKKGMNIFFSEKTGCSSCHSGIWFSDFSYQNIGLYKKYSDVDTGRSRVTINVRDSGKFKVPPLRNVSVTAPYMHDGSIKTLEDVLKFYETGGQPHANKSHKMKKFTLTQEERAAMIDFLKTLTGKSFIPDV